MFFLVAQDSLELFFLVQFSLELRCPQAQVSMSSVCMECVCMECILIHV